jgi:hypothetical protein
MLGETGGVRTYTAGRGNVEAAKTGEQALHRWQRKADTLAMVTGNLRRWFSKLVEGRETKGLEGAEHFGRHSPFVACKLIECFFAVSSANGCGGLWRKENLQLMKAYSVVCAEAGKRMGHRRGDVGPGLYIPSGFDKV